MASLFPYTPRCAQIEPRRTEAGTGATAHIRLTVTPSSSCPDSRPSPSSSDRHRACCSPQPATHSPPLPARGASGIAFPVLAANHRLIPPIHSPAARASTRDARRVSSARRHQRTHGTYVRTLSAGNRQPRRQNIQFGSRTWQSPADPIRLAWRLASALLVQNHAPARFHRHI
ncbi:hypothetical protein BV20DRAFT_1122697 [Pilatotrama ljubarskyi]|nr:hypothetical protein BV20DRAFT_1122697 [Pilatotrama ljubarskyi]